MRVVPPQTGAGLLASFGAFFFGGIVVRLVFLRWAGKPLRAHKNAIHGAPEGRASLGELHVVARAVGRGRRGL